MENESNEPQANFDQSPTLVEPDSPALATNLEDSFFETRRLRHDGWDGPAMAVFCRTLAETGVVTEACRACGMSAKSAYALRHRNAVFARAWEVALSMARERLADDLLARSLKGSVDQIMSSDGAIVGERHHFDNKLAFAILRRLDRRAELGATFRTPPAWAIPDAPPAVSGDWQLVLDALSDDRPADAEFLLTPIPPLGDKGNEGNDPPVEGVDDDSDSLDRPYVPQRVWQKWDTGEWRTDFPPPAGFDGDEEGDWEDAENYCRALAPPEMAALVAAGLAESDEAVTISIEDDEAERDAFFASLNPVPSKPEPGPASSSSKKGTAEAGSSPE